MNLNLASKTAFISGSTQGIGLAITRRLLMEGVKVIINGRSSDKVIQTIDTLKREFPDSEISGIAADFSQHEQVEILMEQLPDVDILINNVGIFNLKAFDAITDEEWNSIIDVNVMSSVRLSRKLIGKMIERKWGRVIFISSEAGINVPGNMIHYGMTKTAMIALGNGLSKLTKGTEVTVNTILGGPTYTDGVAGAVEYLAQQQHTDVGNMKEQIMRSTNPQSLIGRFLEPAEIADVAGFLCSPLAVAINGTTVRADGGVTQTI